VAELLARCEAVLASADEVGRQRKAHRNLAKLVDLVRRTEEILEEKQ
jgi:hypothetical protein